MEILWGWGIIGGGGGYYSRWGIIRGSPLRQNINNVHYAITSNILAHYAITSNILAQYVITSNMLAQYVITSEKGSITQILFITSLRQGTICPLYESECNIHEGANCKSSKINLRE